jgi:uncharacterized protein
LSTVKPRLTEFAVEPEPKPQKAPVTNGLFKRKLAAAGRWLHIYLSLASFAILLFFAVTGLTLNHTEWFADQQRTTQLKSEFPAHLVRPQLDKLQIVEYLRSKHNIKAALSDFRIDGDQISISFKGPGYSADLFTFRDNRRYDLTETRNGWAAVINDLHKGRDTGPAWSWVIDLSAGLMTLVSLTGLLLIFFLPKRRAPGLWALAAGAAISYAVYAIWVT